MAGTGDGLTERIRSRLRLLQRADLSPGFAAIETIERMTGCDAGFTAGARVQVHFEAILLPRPRLFQGDQALVFSRSRLGAFSKEHHRALQAHVPLLTQKLLDGSLQIS